MGWVLQSRHAEMEIRAGRLRGEFLGSPPGKGREARGRELLRGGGVTFWGQGFSAEETPTEGPQPLEHPAAGGLSPSVLKGYVGSQAHHPRRPQSQTTTLRGIFN